MNQAKNDRYYVQKIVDDIERILLDARKANFVQEEKNDPFLDAIGFRLNFIRQAIPHLSPEFLAAHPQLDLSALVSLRDSITHDYENVRMLAYRELVVDDLPKIRKILLAYLR